MASCCDISSIARQNRLLRLIPRISQVNMSLGQVLDDYQPNVN